MQELDEDGFRVIQKRVMDVAATCGELDGGDVSFHFNGQQLPVTTFAGYLNLYEKELYPAAEDGSLLLSQPHPNWQVAVGKRTLTADRLRKGQTDTPTRCLSFVNNIATTNGGTHVSYAQEVLVDAILAHLKRRAETKKLTVSQVKVKNSLFLCVNAFVREPKFDSQSKLNMILPSVDDLRAAYPLNFSDDWIRKVVDGTGLIEKLLEAEEQKAVNKNLRFFNLESAYVKGANAPFALLVATGITEVNTK